MNSTPHRWYRVMVVCGILALASSLTALTQGARASGDLNPGRPAAEFRGVRDDLWRLVSGLVAVRLVAARLLKPAARSDRCGVRRRPVRTRVLPGRHRWQRSGHARPVHGVGGEGLVLPTG
jgi:hypothetical protein